MAASTVIPRRASSESMLGLGDVHEGAGDRAVAEEKLGFFGQRLMGYRWDQPAYTLSYANRRRLEIARAMATNSADPPARRARRRHESRRDARDIDGADRRAAGGVGLHDLRHRARHARRRGHLGPGRRARPRVKIAEGTFDRSRRAHESSRRISACTRPTRAGVEWKPRRCPQRPGFAPTRVRSRAHVLRPDAHPPRRLTLKVGAGELVCLLGGNASGKSTTLKTVLGIVKPRAGQVMFDGRRRHGRATSYRIGRGMAIVPENRRLFGADDGAREPADGRVPPAAGDQEDYERVYALFPLLYARRAQLAGTLSGGEQQMVAMARALMSRPKLLLMDEPSMGLAPILVERSFEIIQQVHDVGGRRARRRAERERLAFDRGPRLRPLDRARRPGGEGGGAHASTTSCARRIWVASARRVSCRANGGHGRFGRARGQTPRV